MYFKHSKQCGRIVCPQYICVKWMNDSPINVHGGFKMYSLILWHCFFKGRANFLPNWVTDGHLMNRIWLMKRTAFTWLSHGSVTLGEVSSLVKTRGPCGGERRPPPPQHPSASHMSKPSRKQALQVTAALVDIVTVTSWETPSQNCLAKAPLNS